MKNFKTKIEGHNGIFEFVCYENTERINIGDKYLFFFGNTAHVYICNSEAEVEDVNINNRHNHNENCFKIKSSIP